MELNSEEKVFLALVSKAAFANPFSDERSILDQELSGLTAGASHEERLKSALDRIRSFLIKIEKTGIAAYGQEDREALSLACLFEVFHRFAGKFDQLIQTQIKVGDSPCPVPFAQDIIQSMTASGTSQADACRYLAMFYQIRRAFYFIDRSLTGHSHSMKHLRLSLWNNVFTHDMRLYEKHLWNRMEDFSTLLLGETGTGKGAAASAIGRSGFIPFDDKQGCFTESFMRSFVSINLSQFPEALIESELFGHRKGAFTGAVEEHDGVFSRCSPHGAIFLDEIGEVSIPVQIKLLQVLQERTYSPVGSHEKRRFSGRVIAATNRSIDALRRNGTFRDDFFYRLCSDVITVPPLRQRIQEERSELDELLTSCITKISGHESPELLDIIRTTIAKDLGSDYGWPGNVRELEQCVRRILLTRTYRGDQTGIAPDLRAQMLQGIEKGSYDANGLLADYCRLLHERHCTYEEVARRTNLDRRTVKKYILKKPV